MASSFVLLFVAGFYHSKQNRIGGFFEWMSPVPSVYTHLLPSLNYSQPCQHLLHPTGPIFISLLFHDPLDLTRAILWPREWNYRVELGGLIGVDISEMNNSLCPQGPLVTKSHTRVGHCSFSPSPSHHWLLTDTVLWLATLWKKA